MIKRAMMRYLFIILFMTIPYGALLALDLCVECIERDMKELCDQLEKADFLDSKTQRLQFDGNNQPLLAKGKVCEKILAQYMVQREVAAFDGIDISDYPILSNFCVFLVSYEVVRPDKQVACLERFFK